MSRLRENWIELDWEAKVAYLHRLRKTPTPTRKIQSIEWNVKLLEPHEQQRRFIESPAKRKVIRAGRRGGKTIGMAILAVRRFMEGRRVLYAGPTQDQLDSFWWQVTSALQPMIDAGCLYKNETRHIIDLPGTKTRIRAKTAWNADTLRGDFADVLILDEFQMMEPNTWRLVGAPMLLDNNGDAVFIYTPPSLASQGKAKADPRHAMQMFKDAQQDSSGRWATFHFSSRENPHISGDALNDLASDMSALAIRQEIEAEDIDEIPGALWNRALIERLRVRTAPEMKRIVVAIDPSATSTGDEAGVIVGGVGNDGHGYVLSDRSIQGSPSDWARAAVSAYTTYAADRLIAESNNGGEMVALTIKTIPGAPPVKLVHASRGKQTRAEPIATLTEQGKIHHVGEWPKLEAELTQWTPGGPSPNRLDAFVWAFTELMLPAQRANYTPIRIANL